ncbi:Emopamil-binding protein-like [Cercospora beticola]|uniref:Emopamil-binding protein-like n=1 Tax=Cercospora beticola TaxID=122368 RepID=A0A2G5HPV6_CERBT|nr:Emopamil-binding protein-like [Cercospora beticola]PIA94586.1 Emopamil-binding protein-like [Cercospora beticola]WPB05089.1 hypothetical protein RHO25_009739 [Cercospora beticola]
MDTQVPTLISTTTVLSLGATVAILAAAYAASLALLQRNASAKIRVLFVWHAFDALIHFILEGSYLYNCFFSYANVADLVDKISPSGGSIFASPYLPPDIFFLGRSDRVYGSDYGTNPFAALWREYAKADKRWGGSDLTVISLEMLTVFLAGPIAVMICNKLRKQSADAWFWMTVLATGELYGGFMTFAPEWLTGSPNLVTDNFMYKWIYLVFFNAALWVVIPFWILFESYSRIAAGLKLQQQAEVGKKGN